jgi:hypothetical protein
MLNFTKNSKMTLVMLLGTIYTVVKDKVYYHTLVNTLKFFKCCAGEKWRRSVGT